MRILIFSQFFSPEVGATQARLDTFASGLARKGHEVQVICEVPNHPQGVVHEGYRRRPVVRRQVDGVDVRYVWVRATPDKTTRSRLAFYGSYAAMAVAAGIASARPDVVLASSPPLPVGAAAALVAMRHRVPWVFDVRDLWPDAAVALGELADPRLLRLSELLERRLYAGASAVTATTQPFVDAVQGRTAASEKVRLLPNGTTRFWLDAAELEVARDELDLPHGRFIWTFAGNIGLAQGLETAIDTAGLLGDDFLLLVLGDGPARRSLEAHAAKAAPGRVIFRDQVPPELAVRYLRASGALLVSLAPDPLLASFVPSKLFDFCAVGRPVLLAAAGEPCRLASTVGAVAHVAPGDAPALRDALIDLRDDPSRAASLATAGRAFAQAHLRDVQVDRLEQILVEVVQG